MYEDKAYGILKDIANENGVSLENVMKEIEIAIIAGMSNSDPRIQAFWRNVPKKGDIPTPVELIAYISKICESNYPHFNCLNRNDCLHI